MEKFKYLKKDEIGELPKAARVYAFKNRGKILYIGKAANIKEKVKNHFRPIKCREAAISPKAKLFNMVNPARKGEALSPNLSRNKDMDLYSSPPQGAGLSNGVNKIRFIKLIQKLRP